MAALSAALLGATALSAGVGLYSSYQQAEAGKKEAEFSAGQSDLNARLARIQADDAIDRGDKEAKSLKGKVGQVVGSQRAGIAAQGIDVDTGSAVQVQDDTKMIGERDMLTIKNNAWREAWGFKVEAQNHSGTAAMTRAAGENRYKNTLLTGGLQAAETLTRGASMMRGR